MAGALAKASSVAIGDRLTSLVRHLRSCASAEGRSVVWTRWRHGAAVHQTAITTEPDRYPELFAALARRLPADSRILSFGCSTGEELVSLRRLMPSAWLTGVEINPRARAMATALTADDERVAVVPALPSGPFDAVLALAVLQREPHRVADEGWTDLSRHYPFERFDAALSAIVERLAPGGMLAVHHAHYRVEDSSVAALLTAVADAPLQIAPLFDRHSRVYAPAPPSASLFVKGTRK